MKIVWLAIALMLLSGMTVITAAYACGGEEAEGKCSNHAKDEGHSMSDAATTVVACTEGESHTKCEGHPEGECSGHDEGEEHAKGKCSGHDECEGHAKGELHGMMENLSDEQRATVHAKIKAMRAEGATHEQIRVAVKEMLQETAEAKVQATEEKTAASPDAQKGNGNGRSWVTKAVFAVGHTFKAVAGALVGIFS
jgi:hypothetical protein